jgi:putative glutamine amidotransferase
MGMPIIGITCNVLNSIPDTVTVGIGAPGQSWQLLAEDYLTAVKKAGGIPIILPVDRDLKHIPRLLNMVDGVLVSGGNDISPMLYNERINRYCGLLDPDRDTFEIELSKRAIEIDKPLLGVCRGIQILNIALGGTVYQDLPSSGFELHTILTNERNVPTHSVKIEKDSPFMAIFGKGEIFVNSFHHQGIREVAQSLETAAVTPDGLVEAVYMPDKKFVMAIQWHPEMMFDSKQQASLFGSFIEASK